MEPEHSKWLLIEAEGWKPTGPTLAATAIAQALGDEIVVNIRSDTWRMSAGESSQLEAFCFSQAAIFGLLVSPDRDRFVELAWNPATTGNWERAKFWESHLSTSNSFDRGLGLVYLGRMYPDVHLPEAFMAAQSSGDFERELKRAARLASTTLETYELLLRQHHAAAAGFAVGALHPESVRTALTAEAVRMDRARASEAVEAGLDIDPDLEPMSAAERIADVVEFIGPLLHEDYPELASHFDRLVAETHQDSSPPD